jgi:hypothetical protein|tara:strand:- start:683 stop:1354 length:672 start_codon:yes stop_codon:yes gene_type:complete
VKLISKKNLLIGLLIVCIILLVCGYANTKADLSSFKSQIGKLEFKEQKYLETISENGNKIAEQEQIILTQTQAIDNNLLEIERLKKVSAQVVVNTITQIDSVFVPFYVDTTITDSVDYDFIKVPQMFSLQNEWYSLGGNINKSGLLLDSLSFNNELKITLGNRSEGILKPTTPLVLVEYSNPYVSTTGLQNIVIQNDLKWYDKKGFLIGIGFLGGMTTTLLLN